MGNPMFIQKPRNDGGIATVANTARDGTGTLANIITCSNTNGIRIDRIRFLCAGTTAANTLHVFLVKNTDIRLIEDIVVNAVTPSNTAISWRSDLIFDPPLVLENGYSLKFAPSVAATFHASVISGGEL